MPDDGRRFERRFNLLRRGLPLFEAFVVWPWIRQLSPFGAQASDDGTDAVPYQCTVIMPTLA